MMFLGSLIEQDIQAKTHASTMQDYCADVFIIIYL
jgi:hypothetical protein